MLFSLKAAILVAYLSSSVASKKLDGRQLQPVSTVTICATCSTTSSHHSTSTTSSSSSHSSSSSSTSLPSSSSSSSSLSSTVSSTTSLAPTGPYNSLQITTTFTQPPACTGDLTAVADWGTDLYDNIIYSSAGYDFEYTSCFPPQFYSSVLEVITSTDIGPFTKLICPYTWESYDINSTYVICCPSGYSLIAPNIDDADRPGYSAACSSSLGGGALVDVTSFDLTGGETVVPVTAGPSGAIVWAQAFDGLTTSVSQPPSSSSSSSTSSLPVSTTSTSSQSTSSSSSSSKSSTTSSTGSTTSTTSTAHTTTSTTSSSSRTSTSSSVRTTSSTTRVATCSGTPTGLAIASPSPSGAVCNIQANGLASTGTGLIIAYTSGSPYVASVLSCAAACVASSTCTNFFFIASSNCNLHYGALSYVINTSGVNAFTMYEIKCFTGTALAPTPAAGSVCNIQANGLPSTGTGLLISYTSGSPYVSSLLACAAICRATSTCTNIFFISGSYCNLHYGVNSYVINTSGVNAFTFYDIGCFTTCPVIEPTPVVTAVPGETLLPSCGTTCFDNMLGQYSTLGCSQYDAYCLCNNVNFGYGIRDCANAACGTAVASTVISFGSAYCSTASVTHIANSPLITAAR